MANGPLAIRNAAESPSRPLPDQVGLPRQDRPYSVNPGFMVVSTQSGKASIVTAAPTNLRSGHPSLLIDSSTLSLPLHSTTLPSISPAPTQAPPAAPTPSHIYTPSGGLSTTRLAAIIVVPLVLLAVIAPIAIVWYINWRRKRRATAAKRRSNRSSGAPKPLLAHHRAVSDHVRPRFIRAPSSSPLPRPKRPYRIVSVPTPTFSSFNFELSRPGSAGSLTSSSPRPPPRPIPRNRRSATLSWGAPPPYASPGHTTLQSTAASPHGTPDLAGSPFLGTAQMVHIRPVSGEHQRTVGSNSSLPRDSATSRSWTSLAPPHHQQERTSQANSILQLPGLARTRQGSADSNAESLHHRSTLQRPFSSFEAPASPALTDVSGMSFDPALWASTMYGDDTGISPIDDQDDREQTRPHQIV
ncbi:MAG: hypothetical protein Q9219_004727 [cf. Caloplaca sp. 3 TL-2023]